MYKRGKGGQRYFRKSLLDKKFNPEEAYFDKPLTQAEWKQIEAFADKYLEGEDTEEVGKFLSKFPNLKRGEKNILKLREIFNAQIEKTPKGAVRFQKAMNYIIDNLYIPKPFVCDAVFFPGENHENTVVNMIRTAKYSIHVCMFTMTNDKLFEALEECWNENVDIHVITDDECVKQKGSDVYKLAAMGIPVKTDNSAQYHMHHKFVIIDKEVLVTGSFNWTVQAVRNNNENVLFIQNKVLVGKYLEEFDKMWKSFKTEITQEEGRKHL